MPHPPAQGSAPTATLRPPCETLPSRRRRRAAKPVVVVPEIRYRRSQSGERLLTVAETVDGSPMIRIRGEWLGRLGFACDVRFAVSEEHGRLVLTLAPEE
jgi:Toxin SymE, type I toxin-antitoxin system